MNNIMNEGTMKISTLNSAGLGLPYYSLFVDGEAHSSRLQVVESGELLVANTAWDVSHGVISPLGDDIYTLALGGCYDAQRYVWVLQYKANVLKVFGCCKVPDGVVCTLSGDVLDFKHTGTGNCLARYSLGIWMDVGREVTYTCLGSYMPPPLQQQYGDTTTPMQPPHLKSQLFSKHVCVSEMNFKCSTEDFLVLCESGSTLRVVSITDGIVDAMLVHRTTAEILTFAEALAAVLALRTIAPKSEEEVS